MNILYTSTLILSHWTRTHFLILAKSHLKYIPSSSIILMVVLLCGLIRVILSVGDRSSSIFSVAFNAMSSKVMAFIVSWG